MEIEKNSYKLSYDEANVTVDAISLMLAEGTIPEDEASKVIKLVAGSMAISRELVRLRLEYSDEPDISKDNLIEYCRSMSSNFISLPRDPITANVIPPAIDFYTRFAVNNPNILSEQKISAASSMLMSFILDAEFKD